MIKYFIAAVMTLSFLAPSLAQAQDVPSYAQQPESEYNGGGDQQIRGRITSFDGGYSLTVRDERGYDDNVELHDGTIINPTGLTLEQGMVVSILGFNAGSYFAANEVDTPYTFYGGAPYYAGHPWAYYGPSVSLGFFFTNTAWWHGDYFYGPHQFAGGARVYTTVHVNNVYGDHDGAYHGRMYVAPPERGGYHPDHDHGHDHGHGHDGDHQR